MQFTTYRFYKLSIAFILICCLSSLILPTYKIINSPSESQSIKQDEDVPKIHILQFGTIQDTHQDTSFHMNLPLVGLIMGIHTVNPKSLKDEKDQITWDDLLQLMNGFMIRVLLLLNKMDPEFTTQKELIHSLNTYSEKITRTLIKLEEMGLVKKIDLLHDTRLKAVSITPKGIEFLSIMKDNIKQ
ncbi:MAG: hypothetical protein INQ03_10590 [Candidatus Heimdallarchaeota archaeon]|nr:hypothetical protein [Candidatus Heimdallarchaeota archaeon]